MRISHTESEWSQVADVVVENGDGTLTALDLTGYTATLSYGYNTSAGDEYSACAPLEVIAQQGVTQFTSGKFYMVFSCAGVFNMMGEDEASDTYSPKDTNTDTVKTILTAIANATMTCFSHCKNYTITFDSEDSLIDTFTPKDYFRVGFKESRLSAFKKALSYTKCKARIEDDGEIHVFVPRISGSTWTATTVYALNDYVQPTTPNNNFTYQCTTAGISGSTEPSPWKTTAGQTNTDNTVTWTCRAFDYEYNDAVTYHNFFEKAVRNRLVIPNRVYVLSAPTQGGFTGNAADATSYASLGRYVNQYHWLNVISDDQCTNIAKAILQGYQLGQEKGHGNAPLNCGQEVMDYIKITDSAANDIRIGNIGYIRRTVESGKFDMEFRFGDPQLSSIAGIMPPTAAVLGIDRNAILAGEIATLIDTVSQLISILETTTTNIKTLFDNDRTLENNHKTLRDYLYPGNDVSFKKLTVEQELVVPIQPGS